MGFPSHSGPSGENLKIGLIGSGSRGQGLTYLIRNIEGIEVIACCDIIPFRLDEGLSKASPKAKGYKDYRRLLDDKNIDAVIISTPFSMHGQMALDALDAGKHVYCEKTMVWGIPEIQSVINKHKGSNLVFQTGHQFHSSPLYQKVIEIIRSGYLGEITGFTCQWNRNGDWRRPVPDPKWEKMINWRMYREYSGGLMAELCSHQVDFINWVLEETPSRITGFGGIDHWKDGRETYDNIHVLFEYPSGADARFTCTTKNSYEDYEIRILGSKATINLDYTQANIFIEQNELKEYGMVDGVSGATKKAWEQGQGAPIDAPGNDPTIDALKQFRASVFEGAPVVSNIETGANTAKCVQISLDAMYGENVKYWKDYPALLFS